MYLSRPRSPLATRNIHKHESADLLIFALLQQLSWFFLLSFEKYNLTFSPNATCHGTFAVSTSKLTFHEFAQTSKIGDDYLVASSLCWNKVSSSSALSITFARDCANMVLNTSIPFSLSEKHVPLRVRHLNWEEYYFSSRSISLYYFWRVPCPRTCPETSHSSSMH